MKRTLIIAVVLAQLFRTLPFAQQHERNIGSENLLVHFEVNDASATSVDTPAMFQVAPHLMQERQTDVEVHIPVRASYPTRPDTIYLQTENERPTFSMGEATGTYEELKYLPLRAGSRVEVYVRFHRFDVLPDTLVLERNYQGKQNFSRIRYLTRNDLETMLDADSMVLLVDKYPVNLQTESNYRVRYISSNGVAKVGSARRMSEEIPADASARRELAMASLRPSPVRHAREPVVRDTPPRRASATQPVEVPVEETPPPPPPPPSPPTYTFDFFSQARGEFLMVEITGDDPAFFDRVDGIHLHTRVSEGSADFVTVFQKRLRDMTVSEGRIFLMHPLVDIPSSDDLYRFDFLDDGEVFHSLEGIFTDD